LEAVKQNGNALEFVQNRTDEICMAAIKQNQSVIEILFD
jgi:hypothetical protein